MVNMVTIFKTRHRLDPKLADGCHPTSLENTRTDGRTSARMNRMWSEPILM